MAFSIREVAATAGIMLGGGLIGNWLTNTAHLVPKEPLAELAVYTIPPLMLYMGWKILGRKQED